LRDAVRLSEFGEHLGTPDVLDNLKLVDTMYDSETHGGRVTTAYNADWLRGAAPLPVVPAFRENVASIFMNRYLETAWMAHRLFPLLQLPGIAFSQEWAEKWRVVDESFQHVVLSLFRDLGKPYFKAVADFVEAKFPFSAASHFPI
jgi:hypothetical protein